MDTKNHTPSNKGQVYFVEFTQWNKDQHFLSAVHMNGQPGGKVLIGRVYLQLDENRKATYITKDANGNELFPPSNNLINIKKEFKARGQQIAEQERKQRQERQAQTQTKEKTPEQESIAPLQKSAPPHPEATVETREKTLQQSRTQNTNEQTIEPTH